MLKNLRISAKLALGFGLVLSMFAVAAIFSWSSISHVQEEMRYLNKLTDLSTLISNLDNALKIVTNNLNAQLNMWLKKSYLLLNFLNIR